MSTQNYPFGDDGDDGGGSDSSGGAGSALSSALSSAASSGSAQNAASGALTSAGVPSNVSSAVVSAAANAAAGPNGQGAAASGNSGLTPAQIHAKEAIAIAAKTQQAQQVIDLLVNAGRNLVQSSPIILAAANLNKASAYNVGFLMASGASVLKMGPAEMTKYRGIYLFSAAGGGANYQLAQAGWDAAVAFFTGLANQGSLPFVNSKLYPTTKAAAVITHGMQGANPASNANVMSAITVDPNAKAGATAAVKSIAASKEKGWWDKFMEFLGLEA